MAEQEPLVVRTLGLVDYEDGLRAQEVLAAAARAQEIPEQLLLLRHPPVVTLGRRGRTGALLTSPAGLEREGVDLFHVDRGGDATFHDPGQLVGYPLLRVASRGTSAAPGALGVAQLVWRVEELARRIVGEWGVSAQRVDRLPGLWVGDRKLVAVGMRVDDGVCRHGFALNRATRPDAWQRIVPCGLAERGVVSLLELLGGACPSHEGLVEAAARLAGEVFDRSVRVQPPERDCVQVVVLRGEPTEVLVLLRVPKRGGFWQPVTGMIEPGEEPIDAARRELAEETGLDPAGVRSLAYVHSFLVEPGIRPGGPSTSSFLREHSYVVRVPGGAEVRIERREHSEARWLSLPAAIERMRWSGNRRALRLAEGRPAGASGVL